MAQWRFWTCCAALLIGGCSIFRPELELKGVRAGLTAAEVGAALGLTLECGEDDYSRVDVCAPSYESFTIATERVVESEFFFSSRGLFYASFEISGGHAEKIIAAYGPGWAKDDASGRAVKKFKNDARIVVLADTADFIFDRKIYCRNWPSECDAAEDI